MKMKMLVAFLVSAIVIISIFILQTNAANNGNFSVPSVKENQGKTVNLDVNIRNNPGLITMKFSVSWDDGLELVSVSDNNLLKGWVQPSPQLDSPYILRWSDSLADTDNTSNGKIATLTFKIKQNAKIGPNSVKIDFLESRNINGGRNAFSDITATVTAYCRLHNFSSYKTVNANTHKRVCNVCGYEETSKHICNNNVVTKATTAKDGKITKICAVCKKAVSTSKIYKVSNVKLSTASYTYNGKVKTPTVTVKNSKGKTFKKNTDYTVSYAKGRKYVGKYAVKVTFKGNYSGTKTLYFTINPKGTKLSSVKPNKKQITAKWKSQKSQTSGYQVQYSTSKSFKGAKTVTVNSNKTTSKTIKKLKGGKKYYVRVRTFKKVGGKKYYSYWSGSKTAKTKR